MLQVGAIRTEEEEEEEEEVWIIAHFTFHSSPIISLMRHVTSLSSDDSQIEQKLAKSNHNLELTLYQFRCIRLFSARQIRSS
jgi:hypothetical protein